MSDEDALLRRWRALWPGGMGETVDAIYFDLLARYSQPHRAYHTVDHVTDCLRWLDEIRSLLAHPDEVELALWFHDAVYDPRRADNEEQSAALASEALRALGGTAEAAERVAELIRLTAHRVTDLTSDTALVCDIDLAILGAEPAAFAAYDAAIRREYAWVPEDVFRRERARVLAGFLARPRIYYTATFVAALEQRARVNLDGAIRHLRMAG